MIIAIVTAIVIPLVTRQHDRSSRVKCMSQLRAIGQCILLYSNDNRGAWPRTRASTQPVRVPTWGTGAAATQPFTDPNGPADNDVSAAIFLLLRTQDITPEVLTCPATNAEAERYAGLTPEQRSNFSDIKRNLSYSYQNPYPSNSTIEKSRGGISTRLPPGDEYPIAADINPGKDGGNSANHDARGQNVLYLDGHAEWVKTALAGVNGDNIYTAADGNIVASPAERDDSILLPTDD
jgi:prepilin-type processing-associated H-X9-DG protein